MVAGAGATTGPGGTIVVSVHGPGGVLDLAVPPGATVADLAREYAAHATAAPDGRSAGAAPALFTATGRALPAGATLGDLELSTGVVLVAGAAQTPDAAHPGAAQPGVDPASAGPAPLDPAADRTPPGDGAPEAAVLTVTAPLAGAAAVLAGAVSGGLLGPMPDASLWWVLTNLLLLGLLVGLWPHGRSLDTRASMAPAFAAGVALAAVPRWELGAQAGSPFQVGTAGLAAALAAGLTLLTGTDDRRGGHRQAAWVWLAAGAGYAGLALLDVALGIAPQAYWAVLLVAALLAARLAPGLAVNVGDRALIDLDRLAVTAWSARTTGSGSSPGRSSRASTLVSLDEVGELAARGRRTVDAAALAIAGTCAVAAPSLAVSTSVQIDRFGIGMVLACVGGGLLLARRSYRHRRARVLLGLAGIVCWLPLVGLLPVLGGWQLAVLVGVLALLASALVLTGVAVGRGWRSVLMARLADGLESGLGAAAIGSLVVATGLFHALWTTRF